MRDWLTIRREATPRDLALVDAETAERWTYAALDADVDVLAGRLQTLGVGPGDMVGVVMETRPTFVRLLWAVQRLGATLVTFNARLTPAEIADQRATIEPVLFVTDRENERTVVTAAERDASMSSRRTPVVSVNEPTVVSTQSLEDTTSGTVARRAVSLEDTVAILFTSGTTGEPKPVRITAQNVLASAIASAFRLGVVPDDRWLLCLPMYHMGGLSIPIRTMVYGTTTVVRRGFDPGAVIRTLEDHSITGVSLVPTMLRRLLDEDDLPDSLRFALVGGGPTTVELAERALERGVPIHPTYGMTETASQITTATPSDLEAAPDSVGRPLVGTDLAILDPDGEPTAIGEQGEIAVAGWTVSPGYWGEDPRPADDWFRTGDVGYRDEAGRLYVTGRASELIVTGGENVVPGEVRETILAHRAVEDAVVVGLPDEEWGERVAALVVTTSTLTGTDLRSFLEARLAGFKLPRDIRFVDSLPRTPSGTVDREAARSVLRDADA
ncbi:Acyl-CoA synthetase (AMP-forming)/AMP-acid ligase II [Halanaeroarchaeum sp. HSR-CO]|uniref:o-succinylbenzoate--CoA ligase n=1 Tax=Halanaeroarchaeum sp. HSR-CO TaxID=2866382 RepID=UPI00217DF9F2|nr:o-succinylbenzoate--CoA ligase [Halanaeroarchaeum sp. HSR-CO]UWG47932.1 Acyl-CoA synthetase (AMP-forming)/AMP-acid ligase II [Halanaeroarchaeum sp. HSR-CO]